MVPPPFKIFHGDELDIGTPLSPVAVLPDQTLATDRTASTTVMDLLARQLLADGIYPIGYVFRNLGASMLNGLQRWWQSSSDDIPSTDLPPGTHPTSWDMQKRDLQNTNLIPSCKIYSPAKGLECHPYIHSLDQFVRLFLASLWGEAEMYDNSSSQNPNLHDNEQISKYGKTNIRSVQKFFIKLERALGHRDYIRFVTYTSNQFVTDQKTSLLFGPTTNDDSRNEPRPWIPLIGKACRHTVTYVVLPDADYTRNEESSDVLMGVYLTATVDVVTAKSSNLQSPVVFEYVQPNSTAPSTRNFFIPMFSAVTLPASIAVRFSSCPSCRILVSVFIHEFQSENLCHRLNDLHFLQTRVPSTETLTAAPFPFLRDFRPSPCGQRIESRREKQQEDNQSLMGSEAGNTQQGTVIAGTIPIFKTIQSLELRLLIKNQQAQSGRWGMQLPTEQMGSTALIFHPTKPIPVPFDKVFDRHNFGNVSGTKSISTIPLRNIKDLVQKKHGSMIDFETSCLSDLDAKYENFFLSSLLE